MTAWPFTLKNLKFIKKRLSLITSLTFIGAFMFLPFIFAGDPSIKEKAETQTSIFFVLFSTAVTFLTGWAGFIFSDRANMLMPALHNWEMGELVSRTSYIKILKACIVYGITASIVILLCNSLVHPPTNPGGFFTRMMTVVWAPVITETVSHLFLLSGIVLLTKSKIAGNIMSAVLFVIFFHPSFSFSLISGYLTVTNFLVAVLTGYLFIKRGFEAAVLTHLVIHLMLVGINF